MSQEISEQQQQINLKIETAKQRVAELENDLRRADGELDLLFTERQKYALVSEISDRLEQLKKLGGSALFWGEGYNEQSTNDHYAKVHSRVVNYDEKVREVQHRREQIKDDIQSVIAQVNILQEEILILQERAEERRNEFVIEREMTRTPYRPMIMPWTTQGEDERRFRKIAALCLLLMLLFSFFTSMWVVPIPDRDEVVKVPERLAKLMVEKQPPPPPPPPEEKKPEEKLADKSTPDMPAEKVARKKAEKSGVLAFSKDFAELMSDSNLDKKLGTQARISNSGQQMATGGSRSLVVAQAGSGSTGINIGSLSRGTGNVGGGSGNKGIGGVGFSRVESAIGDYQGEDRPLSEGPGPSRTDEEIQIVFDRYKSALYRIYNRKLREDPTLQGKMVLRITIEPDGSVSLCKLESSDLKTPDLEAEIVDRVKKINFGAKDGVPKITILYPIDFLPAS